MSRVDDIGQQIAALEDEREKAIVDERAVKLTKMRADIKLYGIKMKDLKTVLGRQKAKKSTTKKKPSTKKAAKIEAAT
jgi:hypothetical protein